MKKFICAIVSLVVSLSAVAQLKNATGNDAIEKVRVANEKVSSIKSKFTQTKKMAFIEQASTSDGDFAYTKDSKLAMIYTNGEVVVVNGGDVTLGKKNKTRNLRRTNKHVEGLVNTLFSAVSGNLSNLDGTLEKTDKSNGAIVFTVAVEFTVGKSKVSKLELKYNASDCIINTIKMIESDGSYTLYELSSKKINEKIDDSVYVVKK